MIAFHLTRRVIWKRTEKSDSLISQLPKVNSNNNNNNNNKH